MSIVTRGDTTMWDIPIFDRDGEPYNLLGCAVWVTVKKREGFPDEGALYQHVLTIDESGAEILSEGLTLGPGGAEAGMVIQELTPEVSALFEVGGYVYDVQVMLSNGRVYTPINGDVETVVPDITNAVDRPV